MIRAGLKPATHRLEVCCSIQLSYRTFHCLFRIFHAEWAGYFKNFLIMKNYSSRTARLSAGTKVIHFFHLQPFSPIFSQAAASKIGIEQHVRQIAASAVALGGTIVCVVFSKKVVPL